MQADGHALDKVSHYTAYTASYIQATARYQFINSLMILYLKEVCFPKSGTDTKHMVQL